MDQSFYTKIFPSRHPLPICILLLFLLCNTPLLLIAQSELKFETLSPKDGFSYRWIMSFHQDSKGFMWIGTYDGLNRYDGYEFVIFKHQEMDSTSLMNNVVNHISEATDKQLWLVTETGVNIYDPIQNVFRVAQPNKDFIELSTQSNHTISPRLLAWLPELKTYYHADSDLPSVNTTPENKAFLHFLKDPQKIEQQVLNLTKIGDNEMWFWLKNGDFLHYQIAEHTWHYYDLKKDIATPQMYPHFPIDEQNRFWYPSIDNNTSKLDFFTLPEGQTDWNYYSIDNHQNIWIKNAKNQLFVFDLTQKQLKQMGVFEGEVFYQDKEGTRWLGGQNGILKITKNRKLFENYLNQPFELGRTPPLGLSIRELVELKNGTIILRPVGRNLLSMVDPVQRTVHQLKLNMTSDVLEQPFTNMIGDQNDILWINQKDFGLTKYNTASNTSSTFPFPDHHPFIIEDNRERIWKTTKTGEDTQFIIFDKKTETSFLGKKFPGQIGRPHFDKKTSTLWAVYQKGMIKINTKTDSSEIIQLDIFRKDDLFGLGNIWCIHAWNGFLWLGSAEGLIQFDIKTNQVSNVLTINNGLPDDRIYSIESAEDNLWLGTHNGLCSFNPVTKEIKKFYVEDGLSHNEFNIRSSLKSKNGRLWFGTINGVNTFFPRDLTNPDIPPASLVWTNFSSYNIEKDSSISRPLGSEKFTYDFRIQPNEQEFSFQFAALRFIDPTKNKYTWYLEGLEKPWNQTSHEPVARYRHIPPGTYTFRVKANDHQGNPAANELSATITVLQVWYKRWWAWSAYIILFVTGVYFFYRFRLHRKIEQQESFRIKELDKLKTKLYTNITHEFRTPLTVILGMSEQMASPNKKENVTGEWKKELTNKNKLIQRNAKRLLQLVNQMLDLSKIESGKMSLDLIQSDIVSYLKYTLESFHSYAESKNIRLHFLSEVESFNMDFDKEKLLNIVSNLLSNAIKFTSKNGDVYFQLSVHKNTKRPNQKREANDVSQLLEADEFIKLSVKDTGVGIPKEKLKYIFDRFYQVDEAHTDSEESERAIAHTEQGTGIGLALVKEFVELMNGTVNVSSRSSKGTEFTVLLPVTRQAQMAIEPEPIQTVGYQQNQSATTSLNLSGVSENSELPLLLIVEDNADVAEYLHSCVKDAYNISYAPNGQLGIEQAIVLVPDIIISDVMMPKKDGFELVQTLKNDERTSHIPIILLTAKADIASKIEGLQSGADAYLPKPFHKEELIVRLQKLIELRSQLQLHYASLYPDKPQPSSTEQNQKTPPSLLVDHNSPETVFIKKVQAAIEKNLGNSHFNNEQLARQLSISEVQLYRKLKALTGKSIAIYIRSIRLQRGKELLLSSDLNVSEIAYEVGFSDPNYFSRTFSREFGVPPSEIRN